MTRIDGTVLVTGGTGALGTAVVAELAYVGADVVTTWIVPEERDRMEGREIGKLAGQGLELVEADLSTDEGARIAADAATAQGPLVALVNLVGGFAQGGRVHEAPGEEIERMLELNLMSAYRTTRACLPAMLAGGGGSIVCVGARAALDPFPGAAGYAVSKAAVLALVRSLAAEYRDDGIRANAILPSVIDTPANREAMPGADHSAWVDPDDIAPVVSFLCSAESAPTSGAAIPVYGEA